MCVREDTVGSSSDFIPLYKQQFLATVADRTQQAGPVL